MHLSLFFLPRRMLQFAFLSFYVVFYALEIQHTYGSDYSIVHSEDINIDCHGHLAYHQIYDLLKADGTGAYTALS
jgi:hypothetical protein